MKPAPIVVGDRLPELTVPITATLIVAGAMATSDFQDVHHDHAAARRRGSPDIFMNILTTNGHVQRFVSDWAGPEARIRSVELSLGVPNYPDDTMVLAGEVTGIESSADGRLAEIAVRGTNRLGEHVTALVRLTLPAADDSLKLAART